jgi:hypothetical protein
MEKNIETNVVKPNLSIFENESDLRLISIQDEKSLDDAISSIEDYMNNNHGRDKSDEEKDKLYSSAKELWGKYAELLRDVEFTFYLNRRQYQFLTDLLVEKMEYDVNTVFLAIELTNMLGEWKEKGTSNDNNTVQGYTTDATEITYIYHLISKHKVKGLKDASFRFAEVLKKIGAISKIISYYDTLAKSTSKDIQQWVASFEPNIQIDGKTWGVETESLSDTVSPVDEIKSTAKGKSKKSETI